MKKQFRLNISGENRPYTCLEGENLTQAVQRTAPNHPLVGCRNGGCGVCRVQVLNGSYSIGLMSSAFCNPQERSEGIVLACRVYPQSDMTVLYLGKSQ